ESSPESTPALALVLAPAPAPVPVPALALASTPALAPIPVPVPPPPPFYNSLQTLSSEDSERYVQLHQLIATQLRQQFLHEQQPNLPQEFAPAVAEPSLR
ncbi:hypothetical protein BDZ91DRAFT_735433, partial [Kalaharituber pfeilii]